MEQRLLATDVNKETGEATIEPAHEALLRQWGMLDGWLTEDAGLLAVLEGIKRASRDWAANNRNRAWLAHQTDRLAAAERLSGDRTSPPTSTGRIAITLPHAASPRTMRGANGGCCRALFTFRWLHHSRPTRRDRTGFS